jgi:hypothetical protein
MLNVYHLINKTTSMKKMLDSFRGSESFSSCPVNKSRFIVGIEEENIDY